CSALVVVRAVSHMRLSCPASGRNKDGCSSRPQTLDRSSMSPRTRQLCGTLRSYRFQDIALQTCAGVRDHRVEMSSCNRPADAERQARLDCHRVREPRLAWRKLLQEVVFRKCMDERYGLPCQIE